MDISRYGTISQISEEEMNLKRGPWAVEEDHALANYVARHGEGRWNSLARCAGLKRTGKSCRLRWLNYLRPGVLRGNLTLEEQLLILELHTRWGNRWSKIAQHLPGRTDNEIKNYWRTRVEKHAKQLKCDVNSKKFRDIMRQVWIPRLVEKIQAAATSGGGGGGASATTSNITNLDMGSAQNMLPQHNTTGGFDSYAPESSSSAVSSDSLGTPISDVTDCVNNYTFSQGNNQDCHPAPNYDFCYGDLSPISNSNQWLDFTEQNCNPWMDGGDVSDSFWDVDDTWILRGQFDNNFKETLTF